MYVEYDEEVKWKMSFRWTMWPVSLTQMTDEENIYI